MHNNIPVVCQVLFSRASWVKKSNVYVDILFRLFVHVVELYLHIVVMYRSNRSFNMPPPPPGTPQAFDTFAVPGRREFDYQSLPGGGEFDPHALEVGDLNCTLDFM